MDTEIQHHIAEKVDFLVANGWDADDALREAERSFGDVRRVRREVSRARRDDGSVSWEGLRVLGSDLRHAVRGIRSNRTFAAAVVATLALGIGAASSIFSVVDALLLRPMPYQDADRWVQVNRVDSGSPGMPADWIAGWRAATEDMLDGWIGFHPETLVRVDDGGAAALNALAITPGAERLLGIPVLLGRAFAPADARPGVSPVVILTKEYWERTGSDRNVLGRSLRLESGPAIVVGVLGGPARVPQYGDPRDLWLPLRDDFTFADRPPVSVVQGLWARLKPRLDVASAQARVDVLADALQQEHPTEPTWTARVEPVGDYRANSDVQKGLWMLSATVMALLLIALVNGVNLTLVRASARGPEMAVRAALGASRLQLVRQLLAEGLVLGLAGGVTAVGLTWAAVSAMGEILPSAIVYFSPYDFGVERRTLLFTFAVSVFVGTGLGLVPAFQALRARNVRSGRGGDSPGLGRLRDGLVVSQIALSMTLLVAAGLLVNSFVRLTAVDPGFEYERVALATLTLSSTRYPDPISRAEFTRRLELALEANPSIQAVTLSTGVSFRGGSSLEAEGEPVRQDQPIRVPFSAVAEDFPGTMGVDVLDGRPFDRSDTRTDNVMVDGDLARFLWGERSPVGRRFRLGEEGDWWTVVGVFDELTLMGRDQRQGPYQFLAPLNRESVRQSVQFIMRTSGDPAALLPIFRETLWSLDPEQWIRQLHTAEDWLAEEQDQPRFVVTLMVLLATVAVALAAVGLYGVLAYSVSRRDRELGIRVALGASRKQVRRMVLREGTLVAVIGVVLGLGGALVASRLIEQLLYEVDSADPATLVVTTLFFLAIATAASMIPARRATRVDPVEALRAE